MKQYLIISIGMILFGLSSTYLIEFINHWFLLGCFAIFCSSVFVLFAQSPKEAIVFYLMYSVSFLLSRYLLTSFDLAPVFYFKFCICTFCPIPKRSDCFLFDV